MKLLLSARDPGAAHHIQAIAETAMGMKGFDTTIYASQKAYAILTVAGLPVNEVVSAPHQLPLSPHVASVLREARQIRDRERPDAVLVGLSHAAEVGIDEALLAQCSGCRTYAMQDFWGDVNQALSVTAQKYFVIDSEAEELTQRRHDVETSVVGSPKHANYPSLDVVALRNKLRESLGIGANHLIFGFFGQNLLEFDGYRKTIHAFARSMTQHFTNASTMYRPHPREDATDALTTRQLFAEAGVDVLLAPPKYDVTTCLAACDVVLSVFSTCGYDALFLNRYAPTPLNTTVYLLFDPELQLYFRSVTGLDWLPPAHHGVAIAVDSELELTPALRSATEKTRRYSIWKQLNDYLADPTRSCHLILESIRADFENPDLPSLAK